MKIFYSSTIETEGLHGVKFELNLSVITEGIKLSIGEVNRVYPSLNEVVEVLIEERKRISRMHGENFKAVAKWFGNVIKEVKKISL